MSMFFSKFTIKNYKCFQQEQSLLFAIAKEGVIGSGITYIVGGNNSGKTTIIEGLSIMDGRNIKKSEKSPNADPEFYLYQGDTVARKCVLVRSGSSGIIENPLAHRLCLAWLISQGFARFTNTVPPAPRLNLVCRNFLESAFCKHEN